MRKQEAYIQELAKKHGILLTPNDPIWLVYTFLGLFHEDLKALQQELLRDFAASLEVEHTKWDSESRDKANRILTAAIDAGKTASANLIDEKTVQTLQAMETLFTAQLQRLNDLHLAGYRMGVVNLICSGLLALAGLCVLLA